MAKTILVFVLFMMTILQVCVYPVKNKYIRVLYVVRQEMFFNL